MASVLEDLMAVLTPEERAIVQAKIDPKLVARDKKNDELFGYWTAIDSGTTTETPAAATTTPATTETHTPALPSAAATTTTPAVTTTPAASAVDNSAILAALTSLKSSIDDRFKNVLTMDKVNEMGANLVNQAATQALKQADEIFTIRDTHQREFSEPFDRAVFEKFVTDAADPTTKRNRYATLTDAYNAMVSEKRVNAKIAKGIADGTKQVNSGRDVPGQTTSTALSPAQQVMAKARSESAGGGKTNLQKAIDQLEIRDRANRDNGSAAVQ